MVGRFRPPFFVRAWLDTLKAVQSWAKIKAAKGLRRILNAEDGGEGT